MSKSIALLIILMQTIFTTGLSAQTPDWAAYPVYEGGDLGCTYTPDQALFKIWAPTAESVVLRLYEKGVGGEAIETVSMKSAENGVWQAAFLGDYQGRYYTYQVRTKGAWLQEVPDLYGRAAGVNGKRSMVVNLDQTNPEGWDQDQSPPLRRVNDAIIYELHVRDASIAVNSGIGPGGNRYPQSGGPYHRFGPHPRARCHARAPAAGVRLLLH